MSVVFEAREVFNPGSYPDMDDHADGVGDADRFADPNDPVVADLANVDYGAQTTSFVAPEQRMDLPVHIPSPSLTKEDSPTASTPTRHKAIDKPQREAVRNVNGKFSCDWPGCSEEVKEFARKCEWGKHMDKHDRPYKCTAEGCEKLPGFTYSGGLLRHEREVHNKHGGPKNSYNCPHQTCKRHTGKGFSRLENLNEHCRRVHTQGGEQGLSDGLLNIDTDDVFSDTSPGGPKRKRDSEDIDLRDDMKRLKRENEELRHRVEAQTHQTNLMMQQIAQLQEALAQQSSTMLNVTLQPGVTLQPAAMQESPSMM